MKRIQYSIGVYLRKKKILNSKTNNFKVGTKKIKKL